MEDLPKLSSALEHRGGKAVLQQGLKADGM